MLSKYSDVNGSIVQITSTSIICTYITIVLVYYIIGQFKGLMYRVIEVFDCVLCINVKLQYAMHLVTNYTKNSTHVDNVSKYFDIYVTWK